MDTTAEVDGVVLCDGTQHLSVCGQITLRERRHNAARHRECHRQPNITDCDRLALPGGLHESLITCLDHDIRTEPIRVEPTVGSKLPEATSGAGRDEMDNSIVEEVTSGAHGLAGLDELLAVDESRLGHRRVDAVLEFTNP